MKKVLSFCLWGDGEKYKAGLKENIKLKELFYPEWEFWLYVPEHYNLDFIQGDIQKIHVKRVDDKECFFFSIYRFLPPIDSSVDVFQVRDLDSRLTLRERLAVDEWLYTGKNLHIMRDHPHHTFVLNAGMWGARSNKLREIDKLIKRMHRVETNFFIDSEFLKYDLYPLFDHDDIFIHDEFFDDGHSFPITRKNNDFIGAQYDESNIINQSSALLLQGYEDAKNNKIIANMTSNSSYAEGANTYLSRAGMPNKAALVYRSMKRT